MWTPCDELIDGHSYCPYADTYAGYESEMCRVCCGLGVDEDDYEEEADYYDYCEEPD
jgi:hypothetical protein